MDTTVTPIEAINEFYALKNKYRSSYFEKSINPIIKGNASKKGKKRAFSRLPKPECVNCKRQVGTIFSVKYNDETMMKTYMAKCGDVNEPCALNIEVEYLIRNPINDLIEDVLNSVENVKINIIKEKNNAMFFKKDVTEIFDNLASELKELTNALGIVIETNILRNYNPESEAITRNLVNEFGIGYLVPFKKMISDYLNSNNELKMNEAINFYINDMLPKLKEIRELKYDINNVEYNADDRKYRLIQLINSIENKEYVSDATADKVISFVKGVELKKVQTKKNRVAPIKAKTKKNKIVELVIEDDDEEDDSFSGGGDELIRKDVYMIAKDTGIVQGDLVKWNMNEYDQLWKVLPDKLKYVLMKEPIYMNEYMFNCVNSKKNGTACKFELPPQTIIPPNVLENGKYDFGSIIVNDYFISLPELLQTELLTNYEPDQLKKLLTERIERELYDENSGYF